MNSRQYAESGYTADIDTDVWLGGDMSDIEILRVTDSYIHARGRRYGRQWFLKALPESLRGSSVHRRRLIKEFEIQSRLHHQAVARAVSYEDIDGLGDCIVMDWVEGRTLGEALRCGDLTKGCRRRIMREIILAVAYLHSVGVAHRDLKPSNIMLRNNGSGVVLVDFGLADTDDYTELKHPAGTPGFISPEQRLRGGAHTSDDIYSLGVIMNMLGTGRRSLARRCTGPLSGRPQDAAALLRYIDRHRRFVHISAAATVAVVVLAGAGLLTSKIRTLDTLATEAQQQAAALSLENNRSHSRISRLTDSLVHITQRMEAAESALVATDRRSLAIDSALAEGCRGLDAIMALSGREVFEKIAPGDILRYDQELYSLQNEMTAFIDRFMVTALPQGISSADAENIRHALINHHAMKLPEYANIWIKRISPADTPQP